MFKLQHIIFPSPENCTEESLFFRRNGKVIYSFADDAVTVGKYGLLSFDTYFNGFSISKWEKYTTVKQIGLSLKLQGKFRISLQYKEKQGDNMLFRVIREFYCDTAGETKDVFSIIDTDLTIGMYSFELMSLSGKSKFWGGYYYTETAPDNRNEINLFLNICTYKREKYIYRNLKMLEKYFLNCTESELYGHMEVLVTDNAKSLDLSLFQNSRIHIYRNKNTGGAGGFTRGMIECMKDRNTKNISHILMMDDDILIHPEAIYRTYSLLTFLKPEYEDSFIGGAMLRMDRQWFQTESGGSWNSGRLVSHKSGLDLRSLDCCLYNEVEESCDFNAWWYCAMPMKFIRTDNLPLPLFIRGDDVEYGLRNMKHLILMNGICVWHEPFEFKYSSSMFYYIFRNRLIDNAIHSQPYPKKEFLKEFREQFQREVFTLRYKNAHLLLDGINDFLKGIDWLAEQDGERLNQTIMARGYKLQPTETLSVPFSYPAYEATLHFCESKIKRLIRILTLNGFFQKASGSVIVPTIDPHIAHLHKAEYALNYDAASRKGFVTYRNRKEELKLYHEYRKMKKNVITRYDSVRKEYAERYPEITNLEFWNHYLEISSLTDNSETGDRNE